MPTEAADSLIQLALPKGRMQDEVLRLLADAGIQVRTGARGYRPKISLPGFETKILKPQNIAEMLHLGSRDIGFAGADWVAELELDLVELLDTGLDPVRIVAAAPVDLLADGKLPKQKLRVASEYERLTTKWIADRGLDATFVKSFGATEVFPPEDADCIVDNTATGSTLEANNLEIVDELMRSSTRFYAHPKVMDDQAKRETIESLIMLLQSVLDARQRVMLELNVSREALEPVCNVLSCMREPTIAPLHGDVGYAIKVAVKRTELPLLIPKIKAQGGTDLAVSSLSQIVA